jgi:hypothetical protein
MNAALMLERSLGSRAWDDSPLQMKQIPEIGVAATRKLVNYQIRSIEDLEDTDAQRIETIIGRNPPFGLKVLEALKSFPKLRVSLHVQPSSVRFPPMISVHSLHIAGRQVPRWGQDSAESRCWLRERESTIQVFRKIHICLRTSRDFRWQDCPFCPDQVCDQIFFLVMPCSLIPVVPSSVPGRALCFQLS